MSGIAEVLDGLNEGEQIAAVLLSLSFIEKARTRGANAPIGLWVAQFSGSPLSRVAHAAGTIARTMLDEEERRSRYDVNTRCPRCAEPFDRCACDDGRACVYCQRTVQLRREEEYLHAP